MTAITIGLVTGDPAGVGPELCAKLIAAKQDQAGLRIAVFGGARSLQQGMRIAGLQTVVPRVARADGMDGDAAIALIDSGDEGDVAPGVASAAGGAASLAALEAAAGAASRREVDAIVYGPLNKQAMWLAGHKAID
jgi:4-hydroxythreonine-4-phosphate dehydrogenase